MQTGQTVDIAHGTALLHITSGGLDVEDAGVYLFTPAGSYLGKNQTTDNNGEAEFFIPAGEYKFRIDYGGVQHWTDIIVAAADNEIFIDVTLE